MRLSARYVEWTWNYGKWLGPIRLTSKELRHKVDLMVTKMLVDLADTTPYQLWKQLQVLLVALWSQPFLPRRLLQESLPCPHFHCI